jgi:hypothetical protein
MKAGVFKRWLPRSTKGSALVEVVFVVFLLLIIIVGIASISVQTTAIENQGRVARELADHARLLLEEEGSWTPDGVDRMGTLLRDRMRLPNADVGAVVYHARRNTATGLYEIVDSETLGGAAPTPALTVVNPPLPNPGLVALDQVIDLDLGEEVILVQTAIRFEGIPRGLGSPSTRSTWSLVPVD